MKLSIVLAAGLTTICFSAASQAAKPEAQVINEDAAPQRFTPNGKGRVVLLNQGKNAFVAKLYLAPGAKVPVHRDVTEEYIYILKGHGVMHIDKKAYRVGPGSAIYMPANAEVTFENGSQTLEALQIFSGPEPAKKYDKWLKKAPKRK